MIKFLVVTGATFMPTVIPGVLLRDRDVILAESIRRTCATPGGSGTVVAVLGAAHCNGVKRHLMAEVPAR